MVVNIKKIDKNAIIPAYQTDGSSGFDLCSTEDISIKPTERALVSTGLVFAVPLGYELQVRPRSGLAFKKGITVLNTPGTVDSDYRGEVKIIVINLGKEDFIVKKGDRIAQGVISAINKVELKEVENIDENTARGAGGFGSTGV